MLEPFHLLMSLILLKMKMPLPWHLEVGFMIHSIFSLFCRLNYS